MRFVLAGQLPSGKNAIKTTRTGQRYPSKRFKEWRDEQVCAIRRRRWELTVAPSPTLLDHPAFTAIHPVRCEIHYTPGDRRRRDVPGMLDALWHVLEKALIVEDDAQITAVTWVEEKLDRDNPNVVIDVHAR